MKETTSPAKVHWRSDVSLPLQFDAHRKLLLVLLLLVLGLTRRLRADAAKKKKADTARGPRRGPRKFTFDPTKLVWPSPPNIGRVHWVDYFAGAKIDYTPTDHQPSPRQPGWTAWRAASPRRRKFNPKTFPFQLIGPYGIAIDSKGLVYVADQKSRGHLHLQH